jgi:hypothetical protein
MKNFISLLLISILVVTNCAQAQNKSSDATSNYFTVENYYKAKWGSANEFIELWKKNHYPLLKKLRQDGDIISVSAEKPVLHSGEDTRWDFKVTIVWKTAALAVGNNDPTLPYKAKLFPDLIKLDKDEQYRFSLLLSHWDVIVQEIVLDK